MGHETLRLQVMMQRLWKNSGNDQTIMKLAAILYGDDEVEVDFPETLAKA